MTEHLIITTIAQELGLDADQIARTVQLLDEDNTVPFIARYRKEVTGGLDEEQLRAIQARLKYLRHLEERKETVLRSIADPGQADAGAGGQDPGSHGAARGGGPIPALQAQAAHAGHHRPGARAGAAGRTHPGPGGH